MPEVRSSKRGPISSSAKYDKDISKQSSSQKRTVDRSDEGKGETPTEKKSRTAYPESRMENQPPSVNRQPSGIWITQPTEKIKSVYDMGRHIGEPGLFGSARIVTHRLSGEDYAVKIISKAKFASRSDLAGTLDCLRAEIEIMKRLDHPSIIKLREVFESPSKLYLVMELGAGGELFDRIQSEKKYCEKDAAKILRQLLEAVQYLHAMNIAHCDIKPENVLFLNSDKESQLKLIDFGMSKYVKRRQYFKQFCGTCYYVAPEVIQGKFSHHSDLWSVGVIMYLMLFGFVPFEARLNSDDATTRSLNEWEEDMMIYNAIENGFDPVERHGRGGWFPADLTVSESAKDLITNLLTTNVAHRYSAQEALDHPWMKGETALSVPVSSVVIDNLKQFQATYKLKNAVLDYLSDFNSFTQSELDRIKQSFLKIDCDGDGFITHNELAAVLHSLTEEREERKDDQPQRRETRGEKGEREEVMKLLRSADLDGDGKISYHEVVMSAINRRITNKEERLWNVFCKFDLDGDGKISSKEIAVVLEQKGVTEEDAKRLIKEVDTDGNGLVDYQEFVGMWCDGKFGDIAVPV